MTDKIEDLIKNLTQLSPEELDKLNNLASKFAKRHDTQEPNKTVSKKKRDKPQQNGRSSAKGRTEPRNPEVLRNKPVRRGTSRKGGGRPGGKPARSEPIVISGENKFDKMVERFQHKKDSEIDKKLWQGREPTQRREQYEDVEVQCTECQLWFDINPELVYKDPETGDILFKCDVCASVGKE